MGRSFRSVVLTVLSAAALMAGSACSRDAYDGSAIMGSGTAGDGAGANDGRRRRSAATAGAQRRGDGGSGGGGGGGGGGRRRTAERAASRCRPRSTGSS